jgi:hypothetical protein
MITRSNVAMSFQSRDQIDSQFIWTTVKIAHIQPWQFIVFDIGFAISQRLPTVAGSAKQILDMTHRCSKSSRMRVPKGSGPIKPKTDSEPTPSSLRLPPHSPLRPKKSAASRTGCVGFPVSSEISLALIIDDQ